MNVVTRDESRAEEGLLSLPNQGLFSLPLSNLGSLNGRHLLSPSLSWLRLLDSTQVVSGETRDAHVVVALEDKLDVADFEGG